MNLNIIGPVNNLSYGYITQNLIKVFQRCGVSVNLETLGPQEPDQLAGYDRCVEKCGKLDNFSPTLIIWHHFDLKRFIRPNVLNIGFPVFETDTFSPDEIDNLNSLDILFTTSQWYLKILRKHVRWNLPIFVINLGVDGDIFKEEKRVRFENEPVKFFNIGKWEIRKGHLELLKAFGEEFGPDDNVQLNMVADNPFIGEDNNKWVSFAHKYVPPEKINILPFRFDSCVDVAKFINSQDVGVFPSKSEGWNMPLSESILCGKPCISTRYSAHTEFYEDKDGNPTYKAIHISETEKMYDGQFFYGVGQWAKFGKEQMYMLKAYMREEYHHTLYNSPYRIPQRDWSWDKPVKKIIKIIKSML